MKGRVAAYVWHTLHACKGKNSFSFAEREEILLLEWNRGKTSSLCRRRSFLLMCGIHSAICPKDIRQNIVRGARCTVRRKTWGIISYITRRDAGDTVSGIRQSSPNMEVFLYPSFKVILRYSVAHKLYLKRTLFPCSVDFPESSPAKRESRSIREPLSEKDSLLTMEAA